MSHHLDSPVAQKDPRLDISDLYLLKGRSGTAFVMDVNPQSGKGGFHDEAMYEFKVDTNGDAVPDLTFRLVFGPFENGEQTVSVHQLTGPDATSRTAEGEVIASGVTGENLHGAGDIQIFAGSAAEPFYIEGRVITAVKQAIACGTKVALDEFDPKTAQNLFGHSNVSAIVIEVPNDRLGDHIGFWGTVALATDAGGWRQVQRGATPLVNTLYDFTQLHINGGDEHADYNATDPADDVRNYRDFVIEKTTAVLKAMGTAGDPEAYATRLADELFPDMLHYQVGSEAKFDPRERNGRDLTSSSPEAMLEWVLNTHIPMGLDSASASGQLRDEFPYVSLPI